MCLTPFMCAEIPVFARIKVRYGFWTQPQSGDCDTQIVRAGESCALSRSASTLRRLGRRLSVTRGAAAWAAVSMESHVVGRVEGTLTTSSQPLFRLKGIFVTNMFCQGPQSLWHHSPHSTVV